jgi:hypothetical protein
MTAGGSVAANLTSLVCSRAGVCGLCMVRAAARSFLLVLLYTEEAGYVTAGRGVAGSLTCVQLGWCMWACVGTAAALCALTGRGVHRGGWLRDSR